MAVARRPLGTLSAMISVRKRTASSEVYYQGNAIVENLVPRFMEKHVMWWKDS